MVFQGFGIGGVEIPCLVIFQGEQELLDKVKTYFLLLSRKHQQQTATNEIAHKSSRNLEKKQTS